MAAAPRDPTSLAGEPSPEQLQGPLAGLRTIDLTDDLGRFATKLLTEAGADVVRVSTQGSPGRPMTAPNHAALGGVADWWYDGGKRRAPLDLDRAADRAEFRRLANHADLILDNEPPGRLAALGLGYAALATERPTLIQVSLTPFGQDGPRAGWQTSDLVASALAGICSVTGEPDRPLAVWGRQAYNFGGFYAAIAALAARAAVRRGAPGQHVDVSLHEAITGSIENLFMQWFFHDRLPLPRVAQRQGSLHWLGAYEVYPAKTGHVMATPTPAAHAWAICRSTNVTGPIRRRSAQKTTAHVPSPAVQSRK